MTPQPAARPSQKGPRPMKATSWFLSQSSHFLAQLPFRFPTLKMSFQSFKPAQRLASLPEPPWWGWPIQCPPQQLSPFHGWPWAFLTSLSSFTETRDTPVYLCAPHTRNEHSAAEQWQCWRDWKPALTQNFLGTNHCSEGLTHIPSSLSQEPDETASIFFFFFIFLSNKTKIWTY